MANVFNTPREIHIRYDIKGSTYGRRSGSTDATIAKKDLDLLESKEKITIVPEAKNLLNGILEKDGIFFKENNIIDYSLLIGIHNIEKNQWEEAPDLKINYGNFRTFSKDGIYSTDGKKMYFFGIIDTLTEFNYDSARKKMEYLFKRVTQGKGVSAVPPKQYGDRFTSFIKTILNSE